MIGFRDSRAREFPNAGFVDQLVTTLATGPDGGRMRQQQL
jgi:hypothetical protein